MVALFLGAAPSSYSRPLRVAFVGDPQADGMRQLEYCRKTVYKELRERKDLDLVIVLGDLVNDDVSLLEPTKASLDSLPCPWLCVPGNHDRDVYPVIDGLRRPRDISTYRKVFGYEDTTFVKGGIRFILMNDVRLGGKEYEGGFRDSQKVWLDSVLRATPRNMPAVLSAHIPFTRFTAKDSLSSILSVHPNLLLMSGHTHRVCRDFFEVGSSGDYRTPAGESLSRRAAPVDVYNDGVWKIPEVQVGAASGTFWLGLKGEDGFPDATMVCGAPRGYFVADFKRNGKYSLAYKTVLGEGLASAWIKDGQEPAIDVHGGEDSVSGGQTSAPHNAELIVNVYGGAPGGNVRVKVPGVRGWIDAVRVDRPAPEALAVIGRNKSIPRKIGGTRNPGYLPMRKVSSTHVWAAALDNDVDLSKAGAIKVRYRDPVMKFMVRIDLKRCP